VTRLRNALIVPVDRKKRTSNSGAREKAADDSTGVTLISPSHCYMGNSATYGEIFDFVDFGQDANAFLYRCGAKNEPSTLEIAELACNEPARLLSVLQSSDKYMNLLKSLADHLSTLKRDKDLFRRMKASPFLLASKEITVPSKTKLVDIEDEEDAPIKHYQLSRARDVVVLDDIISYRHFKEFLLVAPEEEVLENFYLALGAQTISSLIQEEVRIGPHSDKQGKAAALRKHVLERSKIFLHEYSQYRRDMIKRDAKWLETNLKVEVVRSVALRRSLRGHTSSHTEKRDAASAHTDNGWILYVADVEKPDMYQIGQALCVMLLTRPNQQAYIFFEPFLKLELLQLRARGYNVDRILRQKAAEARIADEERRKALEAEQKRIKEQEDDWDTQGKAAEAARQASKPPEPVMPGSFTDDGPEDSFRNRQISKKGKSLFSNLSRRFGFDNNEDDESHERVQDSANHPMDHAGPSAPPTQGNKPQEGQRPKDDGRVTNPAIVQQNLLNAVNATRAHDSDTVFSRPNQNEVKEQATYCDSSPAQNIIFAAEAANGMKVFVSKNLSTEPTKFLSSHAGPINAFSSLLAEIAGVYALSPKVLHIFYDETGSTIAFNSNGSIFCNLRFFLQLHAGRIAGPQQNEAKAEAGVWWWVVLAHELAHNLVQPHNSDHSYYT
jgi:hypothetical protein